MEVSKVYINDKEYAVAKKIKTVKSTDLFELTLTGEDFFKKNIKAQIISWDKVSQIIFIKLNEKVYKAKVFTDGSSVSRLYFFTSLPSLQGCQNTQDYKVVWDVGFFSGQKRVKETIGFRNSLKSPIAGRVIKVFVSLGQSVVAHQPLFVIESMKMENEIHAKHDAIIKTLSIAEGNLVQPNQVLVVFEEKGVCNAVSKKLYGQKEVSDRGSCQETQSKKICNTFLGKGICSQL